MTRTRKNKELYDKQRKEWDEKRRNKADEMFGKECFVCKRTPRRYRHALHNKDGKEHADTNTAAVALKNPDEWVRLCYRCHIGIHFCMEQFGWDWKTICSFLRTCL